MRRPRFGSFLGELHPLLDLLACDSRKNSLKVCSVEAILAQQSLNPVQQTFFAFSTRSSDMAAEKTPR
jgi:hypothetical protein